MGWPGLNHDHVACNEAGCIGATPGISLTIKDYRAVAVGWVAKNFVEKHSKPIEVSNVEWAEISVKGIVKKCVVDGEVHRRAALAWSGGLATSPFAWRFGCVQMEGKRGSGAGSRIIRCKI